MDEQEKKQEELNEKAEYSQEIGEITDLESYIKSIKGVSEQTRADLQKDFKALKEILVASPQIASEMLERGREDAKTAIDNTVKETKKSFFRAIKTIKDKVVDTARNVKDGVVDTARNARDGVVEGAKIVRDKTVDVAETVAIGTMIGADKVKGVAETVAIGAMIGADKVKGVAETVAIGAMVGADVAKETAKDVAIAVGNGTYKTVGTAVGVVSFAGLEAVKAGRAVGKFASQKASDARSYAGEKINDARELVNDEIITPAKAMGREVKQTAIDTKTFGSKFLDLAKKKFAQVRDIPTTAKGRASLLLKSISNKIAPTSKEINAVDDRASAVAQSKDEVAKAFNKMTRKEQNKDDGAFQII